MSHYHQYCPLALASEILCERWNILIISRIIDGCERFNDIHDGVPRISATLLSNRLKDLERAGVITRTPLSKGSGHHYQATEAGLSLAPIIRGIGDWGQKWARDMEKDDLDPEFLIWSMHRRLNTEIMPEQRTVLALVFTGAPRGCSRYWLVVNGNHVEICLKYPGYDPSLTISSDLKVFVEAWRGIRNFRKEIAQGAITIDGPQKLAKQLPNWFLYSGYANIARKRDGLEKSHA